MKGTAALSAAVKQLGAVRGTPDQVSAQLYLACQVALAKAARRRA